MSDSFAGITVPEGDPGALNAAAADFGQVAGALSGVSGELRGMPASLSTWSGPASVSYAGACLTNGGACDAAVEALGQAERAARAYADKLRAAQQRTRHAIHAARDAQHRIDQAERDLAAANAAIQAAGYAESAAASRVTTAAATGVPDLAAEADQRQAQADGARAAAAAERARRELERAQEDLRRAKRHGHEAMDDARDAAQAAAAAFSAAAGASPVYAAAGAPGTGHAGGGGTPAFDTDRFWGGLWPFYHSNDAYARNKWFGDQAMGWAFEGAKDAAIATGGRLGRQAFTDYTTTFVRHYYEEIGIRPGVTVINESLTTGSVTRTVIDADKLAAAAKWGRVGKALPIIGTVAGMASAGYDQWRDDEGDQDLTTTDRTGRAIGVGTYVGGAAAAGAAIGSIVPVGGTLVGAGVGAVVGLAAGAAANAWEPGKHAAAVAGEWTANAAVDTYHWTGDRIEDIDNGLQAAEDFVDDHLPDLPDLNPF